MSQISKCSSKNILVFLFVKFVNETYHNAHFIGEQSYAKQKMVHKIPSLY